MLTLFHCLTLLFGRLMTFLEQAFLHLTHPAHYSMALSTVADLTRSKSDLITENALLRQQLIALRVHRQVKKPTFSQSDRLWLVLLASRVKNWKESLLIFKPDTLLGWHRQGFRLFWKIKSRNRGGRPKLATETITLIQQMAKENRLWAAERIRGKLLKLRITVAKHTIQTYIGQVRPANPPSQTWAIFLKNHAKDIWACDFLPVIDIGFRPLYLLFIVELASRRIVHFGVTCSPTDAWVAQQLREATPFGQAPRFLIRDRDSKYGETFTRVAVGTSIEVVKTPYRAPNQRRCFAAWIENQIASYAWVSQTNECIGEQEREIQLHPREAYIWDCATIEEYRSRRLYSALLSHILIVLRSEGIRRVWIGSSQTNRPSLKGFTNAGFQPVLTLVYARFWTLHCLAAIGNPNTPKHFVDAARQALMTDQERSRGPLIVGWSHPTTSPPCTDIESNPRTI